jgi:hypothetical protein
MHKFNITRLLSKNLVAVLNGLEGLLARLAGRSTKDELGIQLPRGRDVPGLLHLLVDQGAVVLEIGTEAFGAKRSPDYSVLVACYLFKLRRTKPTEVLRHGIRLESKRIKLVGVDGKLLLNSSERVVVDEEEDLDRQYGPSSKGRDRPTVP